MSGSRWACSPSGGASCRTRWRTRPSASRCPGAGSCRPGAAPRREAQRAEGAAVRVTTAQLLAYSFTDRDSNSKPTNRSWPTVPGIVTGLDDVRLTRADLDLGPVVMPHRHASARATRRGAPGSARSWTGLPHSDQGRPGANAKGRGRWSRPSHVVHLRLVGSPRLVRRSGVAAFEPAIRSHPLHPWRGDRRVLERSCKSTTCTATARLLAGPGETDAPLSPSRDVTPRVLA